MTLKKYVFPTLICLFFSTSIFALESGEEKSMALTNFLRSQYDAINSEANKPKFDIYKKAMLGYYKLKDEGKVQKDIVTVIDFRMSSTEKRMWIIDVATNKVLYHSLVAHGKNSGWDFAKTFSNTRNSNMSSIGFYLVGEKYFGKYGLSLRLDGVEKGFNDNARSRAIVMHPAQYVNASITGSLGRLGRSFGCPAIPYKDSDKIMKTIADRSVLFIYFPQKDYLQKTAYSDEMSAYNYLAKAGNLI